MNTNMAGFRWFSEIYVLVLWAKVASAWEGLNHHAGQLVAAILLTGMNNVECPSAWLDM